jgi:type IV secretion system protein VirB9
MQRISLAAIGLLTGLGGALAAETPKQRPEDIRIRTVAYNPYEVVEVWGALLHSTQLQFGDDEIVETVAAGNFVWDVAPRGNMVFIKPKEAHPRTNLQVVTMLPDGRRRSYQIALGSFGPTAKQDHPPFFLVKFVYPSDEEAKRQAAVAAKAQADDAARASKILTRDERNGPRNFAYSLQGKADFEPAEIFDNGKTTTIRFAGGVEMPAIYRAREDGSEELIPKSVSGENVLVHATGRKFVLRRGDEVMCLYNENLIAEGLEPRTNTTSPEVARTLKVQTKTGPGRVVRSGAPPLAAPAAQQRLSAQTPGLSMPRGTEAAQPPPMQVTGAQVTGGQVTGGRIRPSTAAPTGSGRAAPVLDTTLIATGSAGLPVGK